MHIPPFNPTTVTFRDSAFVHGNPKLATTFFICLKVIIVPCKREMSSSNTELNHLSMHLVI